MAAVCLNTQVSKAKAASIQARAATTYRSYGSRGCLDCWIVCQMMSTKVAATTHSRQPAIVPAASQERLGRKRSAMARTANAGANTHRVAHAKRGRQRETNLKRGIA